MSGTSAVTVTDAPTVLYEALGPQVETVMIDNAGAATITIGDPGVVSTHGPQLAQAAAPLTFAINEDILYAVAPTGQTATVYVTHWISGPNT